MPSSQPQGYPSPSSVGTEATASRPQERAEAYLASTKQSSDCWRLCVERFSPSGYQEVKFWCLQTLHEFIRSSYLQLNEPSKATVKGALLTWLQRDCAVEAQPLPSFLRNKLAQTLVAVVQLEYPGTWPGFFRELVAAARTGPALADMFCRIMATVDEDIISLDIPRSQEESKLSMQIKDHMREACITQVADAWCSLASTHSASRPDLAAFVLTTAARYVHWIDIGLVANDRFIPLLLQLMRQPHTGLRCAATDVVIEVVSKRMEPTAKIALVQQLDILPACAAWSAELAARSGAAATATAPGVLANGGAHSGGDANGAREEHGEDEDEELLSRYAKLLATLAGEVMDSLKRVENGVISLTAMGFEVDDEAGREAQGAAAAATALLDHLAPAVLAAFGSGQEAVAMPLAPFISSYVARLKTLHKRNQALPANAQLHLRSILAGIAANASYPPCSAATGTAPHGLPSSEASALASLEEQGCVEERRRELFVLLKNVAKLSFGDALGFVRERLQHVVEGCGSSGFQQAEIAVTLLYELGEGAPEEALKAGSGALGQLALLLISGGSGGGGAVGGAPTGAPPSGGDGAGGALLPGARHRLVALAVLEVAVRYCRVLQAAPAAIPSTLCLFFDDRGLGHPSPDVSTRACYLLSRLSKQLRSNLRPYLGDMLLQLRPHLVTVATAPPLAGMPAAVAALAGGAGGGGTARSDGGGVRPGGAAAAGVQVDDRLYVFEAAGLLLGQEDMEAEQQLAALRSLLQPLMAQVDSATRAAAAARQGRSGADADAAVAAALLLPQLGQGGPGPTPLWQILQALEAVVRLSKGFKPELCTLKRPQLGAMFLQCLDVAIQAPKLLPGHKQLRGRFIAFLHRLVECLVTTTLPFLPAALQALLQGQVDAPDMSEVLALLVQLITRFREALKQLVEQVLPPIISHVHALLGADWDWSASAASPAALGAGSLASGAQAVSQQQQQQQQQGGRGGPGVGGTLEEARERGELQRAYYSLLHAVTHSGLASALLAVPAAQLDAVLTGLARGAASHVDPSVRRTCLQVFERLLSEWCSNGEVIPGFKRFAMEQLGGQACVLGLLRSNGGLDARDAATVALLGEVASALKLLYEKCGDEFAAHLAARVLPSLGAPSDVQQQLVCALREGDAKALRDCLRSALSAASSGGAQLGGVGAKV